MSALRLHRQASPFRRDAGPVAWFVLEQLALQAHPGTPDLVVPTSVRELALTVSLNKDTVGRAIATLVRLGVVEHQQSASAGRFGGGRYLVTLPSGLSVITEESSRPRPRPSRTHLDAHVSAVGTEQLSLLGPDVNQSAGHLDRGAAGTPLLPDALAPGVPGTHVLAPDAENVSGRSGPC